MYTVYLCRYKLLQVQVTYYYYYKFKSDVDARNRVRGLNDYNKINTTTITTIYYSYFYFVVEIGNRSISFVLTILKLPIFYFNLEEIKTFL